MAENSFNGVRHSGVGVGIPLSEDWLVYNAILVPRLVKQQEGA